MILMQSLNEILKACTDVARAAFQGTVDPHCCPGMPVVFCSEIYIQTPLIFANFGVIITLR